MFGFLSFNRYGDQGSEKFTFHVITPEGIIKAVPGGDAELLPLKWWQTDTFRAGVFGGFLGALLREFFTWLFGLAK